MKVSELTGALLDYWVARALGDRLVRLLRADGGRIRADRCGVRFGEQWDWQLFMPSGAWKDGGPIIDRKRINIVDRAAYLNCDLEGQFAAFIGSPESIVSGSYIEYTGLEFDGCELGPTPLIAAMRAFVASKYGDEVPDAEAQTQ